MVRSRGWWLLAGALSANAFASAALVLLTVTRTTGAILLFAVAFGMTNGMSTLLRATLVADRHAVVHFGAASGLYNAATLATRAAAPVAAGLLLSLPGHDAAMLLVLAASSAGASAAPL